MTTAEGADQDPNVDLLCAQDFIHVDLIDAQGTEFPFRMQLNMGDPDQNTGWFATIRKHLSAEFVGNAMSVNGGSHGFAIRLCLLSAHFEAGKCML
ncbi:hypothetical protein HDU87_000531 [Geranomyces variabilis]|uniref:Uncharacterized protein n=1 Tax=Geranomyces variabilis TaxID=109894 RepID=A0AAD5TCA2_9FUNG|nr:hypothetical protein HDU87_000531 [Geranomyces variabilis]